MVNRRSGGRSSGMGVSTKSGLAPNALYYGDNLDVMRTYIEDASIDLIYLDPPFQSGKDYNVLYTQSDGTQAPAQIKAFEDTWEWNEAASSAYDEILRTNKPIALALESFHKFLKPSKMLAYMSMMGIRLIELHRVLKPTGSLYLHCDPTASHYLKSVLDAVFGTSGFQSEVIWKRSSAHNSARRFGPVHDTLLFYTKGDRHTWNTTYQPLPQETIDAWYNNIEEGTGLRYNRADLTAAGTRTGSSGKAWRGIDVTAKGRHWAIPGFASEIVEELDTLEALDALDKANRLHWPKKVGGMPMMKRYLHESKGIPALDVITHIDPLNNVDAERLGYPTQKPVALLEHLLTASSNEGDLVLDPFCGCGTTVHAAHKMKRRWIGIDITHLAIGLIKRRLRETFGDDVSAAFRVFGEPQDLEGAQQLASDDRFQFEQWALGLVGARSDDKAKGADKGIDGVLAFQEGGTSSPLKRIIISVKSGKPKVTDVRDLRGVVDREKAAIGVLITLPSPTKEMKVEAASAGMYWTSHASCPESFSKLQILTIAELLSGKRIGAPAAAQRKRGERAVKKQQEFSFDGSRPASMLGHLKDKTKSDAGRKPARPAEGGSRKVSVAKGRVKGGVPKLV